MIDLGSPSRLNSISKVINKVPYPEPRGHYTNKTGYYGEYIITEIFEEDGYSVVPHLTNEKGTDVILEEYSDIGIEVWNFIKAHSYNDKLKSVLDNLKFFKNRFLVASFISPETRDKVESYYINNPIIVVELGFQILPEEYLSFYKNNTGNRKFYNKRTKKIVRNKLRPILNILDREKITKIIEECTFMKYILPDGRIAADIRGNEDKIQSALGKYRKHKGIIHLMYIDDSYVYNTNNYCNSSSIGPEINTKYSKNSCKTKPKQSQSIPDLNFKRNKPRYSKSSKMDIEKYYKSKSRLNLNKSRIPKLFDSKTHHIFLI